jgi:hypothetical protein
LSSGPPSISQPAGNARRPQGSACLDARMPGVDTLTASPQARRFASLAQPATRRGSDLLASGAKQPDCDRSSSASTEPGPGSRVGEAMSMICTGHKMQEAQLSLSAHHGIGGCPAQT